MEEEQEVRSDLLVDLTLRELPGWADDTPDDRCCTEDLGTGADEVILLGRGAHVFDVGEHPRLDTKLDGSGNDGSEDLGEEQSSGTIFKYTGKINEYGCGSGRDVRNLHVVANLEIVGELQGLSHGDVTPGLEHHHSDGLAGEQVTDDQLSDDVQTDLLVSDGLNDTNGDGVKESNNLCAI